MALLFGSVRNRYYAVTANSGNLNLLNTANQAAATVFEGLEVPPKNE